MSRSAWSILVIAGILIVVAAWFLFFSNSNSTPGNVEVNTDPSGVFTTESAPMQETVIYDGGDFKPQAIAIKKGGTVTFVNQSGGVMWVASAIHPTHESYDGSILKEHCPNTDNTAFDQCARETGDYSFTFNKAGNWQYHDHLNAGAVGRILVVE